MKLPKMNKKQIYKLSDLASDVGLIALASMVLPAILDKFDLVMVLLGSVATIGFWVLSIWLRR